MIVGFLPMKPVYVGQNGDQVGRSLRPGEAMSWTFRNAEGAIRGGEVAALSSPRGDMRRFYVLGFIKYTDDAVPPITRRTFFCRKYNPDSVKFEPVADSDYEHAD
jgi:hypothetical protein